MSSNTKAVVAYFASRVGAIVIFALLGIYLGGMAGGLFVTGAPGVATGIVQPLLCPAGTTAKMDSIFGEWYTSPNGGHVRNETKIIKCLDAQGSEKPLNAGLTFVGVWNSFWMALGGLIAAGGGGAWLDWSKMPKL